jgi:hypothetical protein
MIPTTKISETILEFGEPLIQELPEDTSKEAFEAIINVIVSVWNAVTIDTRKQNNNYETELLQALLPAPPELQLIAKMLIQSKKANYASDPRAVGNYWVIEKDGEFVFRAEARLVSEK